MTAKSHSTQRRFFHLCWLGTWGVVLVMMWSCAGVPVQGQVGMQTIQTRVDSEAARYYVENYLAGEVTDAALNDRIDRADRSADQKLPDRDQLKQLTEEFSVDFASLYLADHIVRVPVNRRFRNAFDKAYDATRKASPQGAELPITAARYEALFVPIYLYARLPGAGADLAAPREALQSLGIPCHFVETQDDGAIETNANLVAAAIQDRSLSSRRLIIVSASKAGSEVALALTRLGPAKTAHVAAWINVVGVLQGTPLVNEHLFRELEFLVGNVDLAGKESLTTSRSRQRFNSFRIPEHVLVVNYLGVPLTGSMSLWAHRGFSILSKYGPNDGVSLLADMILPRSVTLADLGNDHFMRAKPLDLVTVALTTTVIRWLEVEDPSPKMVRGRRQ